VATNAVGQLDRNAVTGMVGRHIAVTVDALVGLVDRGAQFGGVDVQGLLGANSVGLGKLLILVAGEAIGALEILRHRSGAGRHKAKQERRQRHSPKHLPSAVADLFRRERFTGAEDALRRTLHLGHDELPGWVRTQLKPKAVPETSQPRTRQTH